MKKRFSLVMVLMLIFSMVIPTSVFAREEWDGVRVGYSHVQNGTPKVITNNDDSTQEWVYCICPTREAKSTVANGDFRYRYNLSNSPHYFDNSQNINRRDGSKSDYMLDSGTLDFLAKVLYVAYQGNGNSYLNGTNTYSYLEIQNAVYWAVIYGKADPDQAIRGGWKSRIHL